MPGMVPSSASRRTSATVHNAPVPAGIERKVTTVKLKFLGTTSKDGDCPTLYETETGDFVVQGDVLADPEALEQLRDVKDSETFVVVPRALLTRFGPKE